MKKLLVLAFTLISLSSNAQVISAQFIHDSVAKSEEEILLKYSNFLKLKFQKTSEEITFDGSKGNCIIEKTIKDVISIGSGLMATALPTSDLFRVEFVIEVKEGRYRTTFQNATIATSNQYGTGMAAPFENMLNNHTMDHYLSLETFGSKKQREKGAEAMFNHFEFVLSQCNQFIKDVDNLLLKEINSEESDW